MDIVEILIDLVLGCYSAGTCLEAEDGSVVEVLEEGVRVRMGEVSEEYTKL